MCVFSRAAEWAASVVLFVLMILATMPPAPASTRTGYPEKEVRAHRAKARQQPVSQPATSPTYKNFGARARA